jgi:hypothetical protein
MRWRRTHYAILFLIVVLFLIILGYANVFAR